MANNRVAAGMVMVPCVLLGAAFLSTAVWTEAAGANRPLAIGLGCLLPAVGLLAYLLPGAAPVTNQDGEDPSP